MAPVQLVVDAKAELDQPRIIELVGNLTEARVRGDVIGGSESRMVKGIEEFGSELRVDIFMHFR